MDSAKAITEYDIKKHCHVNSNEEGDRFVGIKADSENAMVYFPIGYELPQTDAEIRMDIRHLIQVLSEFTSKEERLLALNKFAAPQHAEFPINAFRTVIEYFLNNNCKYYIETEPTYKTAAAGKQSWSRTAKKHMPIIQTHDGVSSFVYTKYEVRTSAQNDTNLITQINRYCVFEAFERLGWLYAPIKAEKPGAHPDVKTSKAIVISKLGNTNNDKKKALFQGMLDMLNYMEEKTSDRQFYFGTYDFDHVWEKIIDKAFGERDKEKYFPRSRWLLDYGKYRENHPLMPDTIMIYNGKYYILDAKCYKYGQTGISSHLPNASSVSKQITYGEYLEKYMGIDANSIFNAFIMPFNKAKNFFNITENTGVIGEAVGDWRNNKKHYERIQGIVMDTRYLMYHYSGKPVKEKAALAECIETVLNREPVVP
ncbi:MAG: LlaJI family restriction endonuclease [Ruminococcus sp.]|nr:LlaJI family restriction endonuclease [Ruminococcus sp.]MCM1380852.1 LlaJI family restriction endonuclease [Muribaculaceae bacterium]MCM1479078.1 LlaJI family restriction endonuclease [Muribaculaceae bacterium]